MSKEKKHSLQHRIAPINSVAFATALSVATVLVANAKTAHAERPSSDQYWANFTQDKGQSWSSKQEAFRDGWLEGRLDASLTLNEHLNSFHITAKVSASTATLTGAVATEIDKELAANIALGVDGIDKVDNAIRVNKALAHDADQDQGRSFSEYISDISTTASIKTELLASPNINGISMNVDTYLNQVTLTGSVASEAQRKLAETIVTKHPNIEKVHNKLTLKP